MYSDRTRTIIYAVLTLVFFLLAATGGFAWGFSWFFFGYSIAMLAYSSYRLGAAHA